MTKESELPQNCGTGHCSCIECFRAAIDEDYPTDEHGYPIYSNGTHADIAKSHAEFETITLEEDDEPTCSSCTGPMYTQPNWKYMQCDDCGRREDKEPEEP